MHYIIVGFELFVGAVLAYFVFVFVVAIAANVFCWLQENRETAFRVLIFGAVVAVLIFGILIGHPRSMTF